MKDPFLRLAEALVALEGRGARRREAFAEAIAKAANKPLPEVRKWLKERTDLELAAINNSLRDRGLLV